MQQQGPSGFWALLLAFFWALLSFIRSLWVFLQLQHMHDPLTAAAYASCLCYLMTVLISSHHCSFSTLVFPAAPQSRRTDGPNGGGRGSDGCFTSWSLPLSSSLFQPQPPPPLTSLALPSHSFFEANSSLSPSLPYHSCIISVCTLIRAHLLSELQMPVDVASQTASLISFLFLLRASSSVPCQIVQTHGP